MSADTLDLDVELSRDEFHLRVQAAIPLDGVAAIFGPSGGGKSTLLRAIAGFEPLERGHVRCGAAVWCEVASHTQIPPHLRPVGYLFQDARLFSHLNVIGNLRYAVRRTRQPGRVTLDHVIDVLDLESLKSRDVSSLSGGERQRVALGRTLLSAPELLLLDEPLAALDQARKAEILPYLEGLSREFGLPTLYVSHDIDEVARLADRMIVLAGGEVRGQGGTAQMLERLDLEPYTGRFEAGVLVTGAVTGHDARLHLTTIDLHGATLTVPMVEAPAMGEQLRLRIRARDVAIATEPPRGLSIRNILPGTVAEIVPEPETGAADVHLEVGEHHVRARLTLAAVEELALAPGNEVFALIKSIGLDRSG